MKRVLYISDSNSVNVNIAREAFLINSCGPEDSIMYLWRNNPCVVIGRYQNPWAECSLERMRCDGVILQRRMSGGGAVYHDLGNVCFTFVSPRESFNATSNFRIVLDSLSFLGFECNLSGRNDIVYDGGKISGSAFQHTGRVSCHHGTMLLKTNPDIIGRYLTPDSEKLKSHAVKSVSSRVVSLNIDSSVFIDAIVRCFNADIVMESCGTHNLEKFSSVEWNYGRTPDFDIKLSGRTDECCISFEFDVCGGFIEKATVWTDSLFTEWVEPLCIMLKGVPLKKGDIINLAGKAEKNSSGEKALALLSELVAGL